MKWYQQHIDHFFQNDENFVEYYCDHLTLLNNDDQTVRSRLRLLVKQLAILMPNGAHRSPGYAMPLPPRLIVSCFTGPQGRMDGNWRVAIFFANDHFYIGFHCKDDATDIDDLLQPWIVTQTPKLRDYSWSRIIPGNDHLCIQIPDPVNGEFIEPNPLANGQPLALALQSINQEKYVQAEVDWYTNYLVARDEPADGVLVPSVFRLKPL